MISNENAEEITEEGKFPCAVCRKGITSFSISVSFAGVAKSVLVLEVNWKRM